MKKIILAAICLLSCVSVASAENDVLKVYGSANAVWYDNAVKPSDIEIGANVSASLHNHLAINGTVVSGLQEKYVRGALGPRVTVSDSSFKDMSVGLGVEYQVSNKLARANEWCASASLGFRPWAESPRLILGAQASYGLESNTASVLAAIRYRIGGKY